MLKKQEMTAMTFIVKTPVRTTLAILALAVVPLLTRAAGDSAEAVAAEEQKQIAILRADAKPADKALACKRLAIYGSKEAVPFLAPLLGDPQLASWARIALEAIPGPEANKALRDALAGVEGRLLIGAINSLGVRRDPDAVSLLAAKLRDDDAGVAEAASVALGNIGGAAAADALSSMLADGAADRRSAAAEGCVLCAERLLAAGKPDAAIALYDAVRAANVSPQRTVEAIRGAIVARGKAGVPMLAELLKSPDDGMFGVGLRVARELPGADVAAVLVTAFDGAEPGRQAGLLLALGDCCGADAVPVAIKATRSTDRGLQLLAVKLLDRLGNPAALQALLSAAAGEDAAVSRAAQSAVARLPGADVDRALAALLGDADPARRLAAVDLIVHRGGEGTLPLLLRAARDNDSDVRASALKAIGDLSTVEELPVLLELLLAGRSDDEIRAAENAVISTCTRSATTSGGRITVIKAVYGDLPAGTKKDVTKKVAQMVKAGALAVEATNGNFGDPVGGVVKKLQIDYKVDGNPRSQTVTENETLTLALAVMSPVCSDAVLAALGNAPKQPRLALLRILRSIGSSKALTALRAAVGDADADVSETAIRAICDWPSAEALPDLMERARTSSSPTHKILSLRGAIRLAGQSDGGPAEQLAALKTVIGLIERPDETRLALAALGRIPSVECLTVITPYLDDPGLKEESGAAAVAVCEGIPKPLPPPAFDALRAVVKQTASKQTRERAEALLEK